MAEIRIDAHVHLSAPGGPRLMLERFSARPLDRWLAHALTWLEPIAHPVLDQIALHGRTGWLHPLAHLASDLGWPQVQAIFARATVQRLLEDMDRSGVSHALVHTIDPYLSTEAVATAVAPWPGRLSLSVGLDPFHPDPSGRLERLMERHPVHGLKIHPQLQAIHPLDRRIARILGLARRYRLPVTIHTGTFPFRTAGWDDARLLAPLLDAWSDLTFLLAHMGWDQSDQVLALARRRPWAWVETSWQDASTIRKAVETLGPERVVFGSDWPLLKPRYALAHIRRALPEAGSRGAVVGGNAMRLLGLRALAGES